MDMAEYFLFARIAMSIIFEMSFMMLLIYMLFVPVFQFFFYFRVDIAVFIKEIGSFVKINYDMKQMINTFAFTTNCRYYETTKKLIK